VDYEPSYDTYDLSLDSHCLWYSDSRLHLRMPKDTPYYAWSIREIFLPVLIISGLWMWKGHVVRRLFSRRRTVGVVSSTNG
jgi:hypothetical protein